MAPRRRPPPPPPRWNRRATLVVFSAIVGLVVGAGLWLATTSTRLPSREQTRAGSARLVAHAATRPVAARPATLRDSYGDDDEEGDGGEGNAAALSKRPGAKIASPDFMVDEEALRETATLTAPPKPTRPARPLNWRKAYEQWASLRAEAVIRAIHDDLSQPVRPLTKAEAQFLEGAYWLPPQFLEEEETVKAVLSWETQRGAAMKRHPTPALEAKYCTAGQPAAAAAGEAGDAPACRRYIARVPDRGSRIGHYFDTWHNTYSLALQYNLTFLYHPLLANQPEQVLFERFFGFGYDEPFRYYETCTYGAVGEECGRYLPCLKIIPVTPPPPNSDAAKQDFWDTTFSQQYDACDVLFVVRDDRGYPAVRSTDPYNRALLRRKYYRARRLAPLTPMFAEGDLTIAIHARRGDIVNTTNAASRWTADTVYQTVLDQLLDMICRPEVVGRRRLLVNIFSEGRESHFPALVKLRDEGKYPATFQFQLNKPVLTTLAHLVEADVLVMAKSGFSTLAGKLREDWKLTLFPSDHWAEHAASWLPYSNTNGAFAVHELTTRLPALIQARDQWRQAYGPIGWTFPQEPRAL